MERRLMRSRIQVHKRAVEAAARKPCRTKAAATSWRRTRHAGKACDNSHATWWSRRTGEPRRAATALSAAAEVASSSSSPEEEDGLPNLPVYLPKVEARELEDAKNLILPATKSGRDIGLWLFRLLFTGHRHSWRLLPAFALTFGGKFAGIYGAILFKKAVDSVLDTTANAAGIGGLKVAVAFLLGSGLLKALKSVSGELRHVIFAPLSQQVSRILALKIFSHLFSLDSTFHVKRQTGGVINIVERGIRAILTFFRTSVLTLVPTLVEWSLVCGYVANKFSAQLALVLVATFVCYLCWTVHWTQVSARQRKETIDKDIQVRIAENRPDELPEI